MCYKAARETARCMDRHYATDNRDPTKYGNMKVRIEMLKRPSISVSLS
jgi:hypothetical protein